MLFVGYANDWRSARRSSTGKAVLWSASRDELWRKGATSGDELELVEVRINCEQNALAVPGPPGRRAASATPSAPTARPDRPASTAAYGANGDLEFIDGFGPAGPDPNRADDR